MSPRRALAALCLALGAATAHGTGDPGCVPGGNGGEGPCPPVPRLPSGTEASYTAIGTVKRVDLSSGLITVAHDDVKALRWPAMTMVFGVSRPDLLRDIVVGRRYELTFVRDGNRYLVTDMRPQ